VVLKNGVFERVSVSCHKSWHSRGRNDVKWEGDHPRIVYHKDGPSTHCFRYAETPDVSSPAENHLGIWVRGALVDYAALKDVHRNAIEDSRYWNAASWAFSNTRWRDTFEIVVPELKS